MVSGPLWGHVSNMPGSAEHVGNVPPQQTGQPLPDRVLEVQRVARPKTIAAPQEVRSARSKREHPATVAGCLYGEELVRKGKRRPPDRASRPTAPVSTDGVRGRDRPLNTWSRAPSGDDRTRRSGKPPCGCRLSVRKAERARREDLRARERLFWKCFCLSFRACVDRRETTSKQRSYDLTAELSGRSGGRCPSWPRRRPAAGRTASPGCHQACTRRASRSAGRPGPAPP